MGWVGDVEMEVIEGALYMRQEGNGVIYVCTAKDLEKARLCKALRALNLFENDSMRTSP